MCKNKNQIEKAKSFTLKTYSYFFSMITQNGNFFIYKLLILSFVFNYGNIFSQQTFSEFKNLEDGTVLEVVKNSDLNVIKEIHKNKSGQVIQFYNYNPQTAKLEGAFDNGLYKGIYTDDLITSENYIRFLNKGDTRDVDLLFFQGKINKGKLSGKYNVISRHYYPYDKEYETQNRDLYFLTSYFRGEQPDVYQLHINSGKYTDKNVGEMVFEDGLIKSFDYNWAGRKYKGNFISGFPDYFVIRELSTSHIIDSMKIDGKVFVKAGVYVKNSIPAILDSLNKIKMSGISDIDYKSAGLDTIGFDEYTEGYQSVPMIDPLNHLFLIVKRKIIDRADYSDWLNYTNRNLQSVSFIPTSAGKSKGGNFLGLSSGDQGKISSGFSITKFITSRVEVYNGSTEVITTLIPFFEYHFNIAKMTHLNGTLNGYRDYYSLVLNVNADYLSQLPFYPNYDIKINWPLFNKYASGVNAKEIGFKGSDFIYVYKEPNTNIEELIIENAKRAEVQEEIEKSKPVPETVYSVVEEMPMFPGGMPELNKFISDNLVYPSRVKTEGISGKCYVKFVVNESGGVENPEVSKGIATCPECDSAAVDLVKKFPKFSPGKQNGKPVKVLMNLPIRFDPN